MAQGQELRGSGSVPAGGAAFLHIPSVYLGLERWQLSHAPSHGHIHMMLYLPEKAQPAAPSFQPPLSVSAGESGLWGRLSSTHQGTARCYLSSFKRYAKGWVLKPECLLRNEAYANPTGDRDG